MRAQSTAAVIVLLLSGCMPFHLWHRDRHQDPALDRKAVLAKEKPASLIAADGSRCLVADDRKYAQTEIGDRVWCVWSGKDGRKTAYSWNGDNEPPGRRHEPGSKGSGAVHIFGWP